MTSFVYYVASSIDGRIADPDDSLQWLFDVVSPEAPDIGSFMSVVGVQVMGSRTYEWLLRNEGLLEEPHRWQEFFGAMPTKVLSSRVLPVPLGADVEVLSGPVGNHLERIVASAHGTDVWIVGGGEVAGQFLDAGALDRIELTVAPAVLGEGAPLLPRFIPPARLRLDAVERIGEFACLTYVVVPG